MLAFILILLKPATGRPCALASEDSGIVPAITSDCSRVSELLMRRRYFDLCVTASSRAMLTFENNVSCSSRIVLLLRFIAGNVDVNTLASKRFELLGNADILRMRRRQTYIQFDLCVLAYSSCRDYVETQERKRRPVAGLTCLCISIIMERFPLTVSGSQIHVRVIF